MACPYNWKKGLSKDLERGCVPIAKEKLYRYNYSKSIVRVCPNTKSEDKTIQVELGCV